MDHLINWVWQGSLVAAIAVCLLGLMARTRAQARYLVCWLALLSITTLPLWPAGGPAVPAAPPLAASATLGTQVVTLPATWWTSSSLALVVGGLWCLWAIGRLAADILATRRSRVRCAAFPADLESQLRCWTLMRTRGRRTSLALSRDVGAGAVLGVGPPIVAVAPVLLSRVTPDEVDRVVIHEWAHVQRRDDLVGIAHAMVRLIAGWHPAVWWLERRMLIEREIACDETAVAVTGCPKRYAACLTTIAGLPPTAREPMGAIGVLSTPALSVRVTRILSGHTLASAAWSATAAAIAMLMLAAASFAIAGHRLVGATDAGLPANDSAPVASGFSRPSAELRTALSLSKGRKLDDSRSLPATAGSHGGQTYPVASGSSRKIDGGRSRPAGAGRHGGETYSAASGFRRKIDGRRGLPAEAGSYKDPVVTAPDLRPLAPTVRALPIIDQQPLFLARVSQPDRTSPWASIADAGVSVSRGSQQAGVATARFVTRFGKKIAGSF
jgi:D-alanyl-D-alanine endopeptidase (penicillin-binding protein 7)